MPEVLPIESISDGRMQGEGRYEFKYVVEPSKIDRIRAYVRQFCEPDPHGNGSPPNYEVTTLQLDTPFHDLGLAKERDALNRFKLRIRAYTPWMDNVLKLEVKQKINDRYFKFKARLDSKDFDPECLLKKDAAHPNLRPADTRAYLTFVRLVRELSARPAMYIRYRRESYNATMNGYARVTLDSRLRYARASKWSPDPGPIRWTCMDTATALKNSNGGFILELKSTGSMPVWMIELIERFELDRVGFCKYSTALRLESIFRGIQYSEASDACAN